jgi:hypothetical protein
MSENPLSRSVALKALAAEVAARLERGEQPGAICAALLAEGFPPEVIDQVFEVCERQRPVTRQRAVLAAILAASLLLGLPPAGAIGGVWAAVTLRDSHADPEPDTPDVHHPHQCGLSVVGPIVGGFLVGGLLGLTAAACAVPLAVWSIHRRPRC